MDNICLYKDNFNVGTVFTVGRYLMKIRAHCDCICIGLSWTWGPSFWLWLLIFRISGEMDMNVVFWP